MTTTLHSNAKIKGVDFERIHDAIAPLDTVERRARYLAGDFPRADRVKDLNLRYRWDLLWESVPHAVITDLYDRLSVKDAHIDTALRSIVPELQNKNVSDRMTV